MDDRSAPVSPDTRPDVATNIRPRVQAVEGDDGGVAGQVADGHVAAVVAAVAAGKTGQDQVELLAAE